MRKYCAFQRMFALASVDVLVIVLAALPQLLHFEPKRLRKPRIILPSDLERDCISWRLDHKALVSLIRIQLWIERHPDFRSSLANGRDERHPRRARDVHRLLYPTDINAFERLDCTDIRANAGEAELSAIAVVDGGLLRRQIIVAKPHLVNLIRQEFVNAVRDGRLKLASAENAQWALRAHDQQSTSDAPGLCATTAAVQRLVSTWRKYTLAYLL